MFLPPPERRGEIHFLLLKSLPYTPRLILALASIMAGVVIQALLLRGPFFLGLAPVAFGVLLLLTRGFDNAPHLSGAAKQWRSARRQELEQILRINAKQRRWDIDAVDATNPVGCLTLVGVAALVVVGSAFLAGGASPRPERMIVFLIVNAAVMLLPFWVTGVRSILKNPRLIVKTNMLLGVHDAYAGPASQNGEEFQYQIEMMQAEGATGGAPCDVKGAIVFSDAPPGFLGLQMQIAINSVQGADYPYFYCVVLAKKEFGGFAGLDIPAHPREIVLTAEHQADVDVLVIRQQTTKNSGYHTPQKSAVAIFLYALDVARACVKARTAQGGAIP